MKTTRTTKRMKIMRGMRRTEEDKNGNDENNNNEDNNEDYFTFHIVTSNNTVWFHDGTYARKKTY
jgi:hypothetical protein